MLPRSALNHGKHQESRSTLYLLADTRPLLSGLRNTVPSSRLQTYLLSGPWPQPNPPQKLPLAPEQVAPWTQQSFAEETFQVSAACRGIAVRAARLNTRDVWERAGSGAAAGGTTRARSCL